MCSSFVLYGVRPAPYRRPSPFPAPSVNSLHTLRAIPYRTIRSTPYCSRSDEHLHGIGQVPSVRYGSGWAPVCSRRKLSHRQQPLNDIQRDDIILVVVGKEKPSKKIQTNPVLKYWYIRGKQRSQSFLFSFMGQSFEDVMAFRGPEYGTALQYGVPVVPGKRP